jgi:hypothetical protein
MELTPWARCSRFGVFNWIIQTMYPNSPLETYRTSVLRIRPELFTKNVGTESSMIIVSVCIVIIIEVS